MQRRSYVENSSSRNHCLRSKQLHYIDRECFQSVFEKLTCFFKLTESRVQVTVPRSFNCSSSLLIFRAVPNARCRTCELPENKLPAFFDTSLSSFWSSVGHWGSLQGFPSKLWLTRDEELTKVVLQHNSACCPNWLPIMI